MINVGINGFGRIGKCLLIQLLEEPDFCITCINVIGITINEIEDYLKRDSTHHYNKNFTLKIISDDKIELNPKRIVFFGFR